MMNLMVGKSLNTDECHQLVEAGGIAIEVVRAGRVIRRIAEALTWIIGGNVVLHHLLVDRIPVTVGQRRVLPMPARRIRVRLMPTNPYSLTQRSISGMQFFGETRALCGSIATPMKFFGNSEQTRWISSLQALAQASLVAASPRWWPMPAARGEKIVRSVPRSRCTLSWPPSIVWRISSSVIARARRRRLAGGVRLDLLRCAIPRADAARSCSGRGNR